MLALAASVSIALVSSDLWQLVASHYRRDTVAEKVSYRAQGAGVDRTSTVVLRVSHDGPNAPVVRVDMGNLILWADSTRLVAVHAGNTKSYFEHTLSAGLTTDVIAETFPPLVMPQLGWAISTDEPHDSWWPLMGVGAVRVGPMESTPDLADTLSMPLASSRGSATVDALSLRRVRSTRALAALKLTYAGEQATTLELTAQDMAPTDIGAPASWAIPTAGRARVERLADLRPIPGEVGIGEACPPLSLMTGNVEGWSFADATSRLRSMNPQPSGPTWIAFLIRLPDQTPEQQPATEQAARALDSLTREFSIQRMQGLHNSPRLEAHQAIVLELGQVNQQRVAELSKAVIAGTESLGEQLFISSGLATFHRFAPGSAAAILVLDEHQRIAGLVRLDGRMVDASTIADEVRRIISTRAQDTESSPPGEDGSQGAGDGGH